MKNRNKIEEYGKVVITGISNIGTAKIDFIGFCLDFESVVDGNIAILEWAKKSIDKRIASMKEAYKENNES